MGQKASKDLPTQAGPLTSSPHRGKSGSAAYNLDSGLPAPQARPKASLRRIYVQRSHDGALNFTFSSFQRPYNQQLGTIHYISSVVANSTAAESGLKIGQRLLRINGNTTSSCRHKEVVEMIQSRPAQQPIVLHVSEPDQETQELLQRQSRSSVRSHTSQHTPPPARRSARRPPPQASAPVRVPAARSVVAVVSPPNRKDMVLVVQRTASDGWSLLETQATAAEDFGQAIHRLLASTFAQPPAIAGLLRFEHSSPTKGAATRIVFHVECSAAVGEANVPMSRTSTYHRAAWMLATDIAKLHRKAGPAPWGSGAVGLANVEVLDWARYLASGCVVAPLHFLAMIGDKVWNEKTGGQSASAKREVQRRRSFTGTPSGSASAAVTTNGRASPPKQRSAPAAKPAVVLMQEPEPEAIQEPPTPSASGGRFSPPAVAEVEAPSHLQLSKPESRRVSFVEERNTEHETYAASDYRRRLDATNEGFNDLRELVSHNQGQLEEEQKMEVEHTVSDKRLRAFYVMKNSHPTFGFTMKAVPKVDMEGCVLSEAVIIDTVDPSLALAADGNVHQGDRIVKINGQWVVTLQHATYLMEIINTHPALDITICRNEPLPPAVDLESFSDEQLQEAAFAHYGLRILVDPVEGWSREQTIEALTLRFASPANGHANGHANGGHANGNGVHVNGTASTKPSSSGQAAPTALRQLNSQRSKDNLKVSWDSKPPSEHDMLTKAEYVRPLDPGSDHSDLRSLFFHNQQVLEQEQQREAEDYCEMRRMRNHYITKQRGGSFGFKIKPIEKDLSLGYLFLEGVAIVEIDPEGPLKGSALQEGDRLVKVNGQWVLNHQHAEYLLFDLLRRARALDLTITRDEPLPGGVDLNTITDQELQELALEHAGVRADLEQGTHTRDKLTALVRRRFGASSTAALSNLQGQGSEEDDDEEC
eukprot:m.181692 g.181692  ORF g.181692 m.181692 type:complete len:931 (+) comp16874_c0_seq5:77-2869(+)